MLKNAIFYVPRGFVRWLKNLKQHLESTAMAQSIEAFRSPGSPETAASQTSYSQYQEDRTLSAMFGEKASGTALEVGGFDGVTHSNTYLFEQKGWRTMIVEPMPEYVRKIRSNRKATVFECAAGSQPGMSVFTVAKGAESLSTLSPSGYQLENMKFHNAVLEQIQVPVRTLDDILESANVEKLDFVTIDVEGHESAAIAGFNLSRWKPDVVLVEDGSLGLDPTVRELMETKGYRRFLTTGCNDWYAPESNKRVINAVTIRRDRFRIRLCRALGMLGKFGARLALT